MLTTRLLKTASFRLSVLYAAVFAVCFAILLLVTYWTTTSALRDQIRSKVMDEIRTLSAEHEAEGTDAVIRDINERLGLKASETNYYFLADPRGRKAAGNLDGIEVNDGWREVPFSEIVIERNGEREREDDDHQLWGRGVHLADGSFLFVGQDAHRVSSVQEAIVGSFAWSAGMAFLLAALAGITVSQGFLKRIDAINTTSLAIIDGKLKQRIPVRGTSDEIDRLSMNLNRLFDSNQSLLESLKQVSTSIAHDLRTPLSRLRQGLEDARLGTRDTPSREQAIDTAIVEADQLLATFSALLRIAQIESGSRKAGFKNVDLSEIFERVANAYRAVAEDEGKELTTALASSVLYHGDAELLIQMLANLVENAIRHTPAQTKIGLTLERTPDGAIASVSDSGPGIPADERAKVFERFYRLDASRGTAGSGLGLALVAAVTSLHGIKLELVDNEPGLKILMKFLRRNAKATNRMPYTVA